MTYFDLKSILKKQTRREEREGEREREKGKPFLRHQLGRGMRKSPDKYLSSKGSGDNDGDSNDEKANIFLLSP